METVARITLVALVGCGIGYALALVDRKLNEANRVIDEALEALDAAAENPVAKGECLGQMTDAQLERLWNEIKALEPTPVINAHRTPKGWHVSADNESDAATAMIVISTL